MSATVGPTSKMSRAEYLAWETAQPDRHQYLRGEVYAMAGGSPRHNLLAANVLARLHASLRGGACRPFSSDQKIYVPATGDYVYPDATVICGPVELHEGSSDVIENPRVVVEVLSKSTEQHDRGDKWEDYREIPSLTDYVLVSQRVARIEHFGRDADGSWRYRVVGAGGRLELSTGTVLVVDELYEGAFDVPGDS
ncbi:MAG TPA: Uma2 family endonuclease [Labilithrix sp.]|jgi:Uma2 family endonuclease|nr:Uma2 family endonuclease [Labilithrix sp.]